MEPVKELFYDILPLPVGAALDKHFEQKGWELQFLGGGYQIFFGVGVQVDNLYEYGFPHLYSKEDLVTFAMEYYHKHLS